MRSHALARFTPKSQAVACTYIDIDVASMECGLSFFDGHIIISPRGRGTSGISFLKLMSNFGILCLYGYVSDAPSVLALK